VVALSGGSDGDALIRRAARIAARCGGDLLAETRHTSWAALQPMTTITSRIIRQGGGIDVHIVTCTPTANGARPRRTNPASE
jgi:hypothetical protein